MARIKFEKIRDWDGEVKGYRLGKYYLLKHYTWNNYYCWGVTDTDEIPYSSVLLRKFEEEHFLRWVNSCKQGKELLIKLNYAVYKVREDVDLSLLGEDANEEMRWSEEDVYEDARNFDMTVGEFKKAFLEEV